MAPSVQHTLLFALLQTQHQQVPDDDDALILSFWLLGLAPSSLGLQELASQVGSINYPLALMVSPA